MTNNEYITHLHACHLKGEISFYSYLDELIKVIGATPAIVESMRAAVLVSKDPAFNDIPRPQRKPYNGRVSPWDLFHGEFSALARAARVSWSLSDSACCARHLARTFLTAVPA